MSDEIKDVAKEKARKLGTTLTDLINDAVEYYIENIEQIDREAGMKLVSSEIKETPKINQLEKEIQDLKEQIQKMKQVDNHIDSLREEVETMKEHMEGEYLQSIVRTHIDSKVGKTLEDLQKILQRLG